MKITIEMFIVGLSEQNTLVSIHHTADLTVEEPMVGEKECVRIQSFQPKIDIYLNKEELKKALDIL